MPFTRSGAIGLWRNVVKEFALSLPPWFGSQACKTSCKTGNARVRNIVPPVLIVTAVIGGVTVTDLAADALGWARRHRAVSLTPTNGSQENERNQSAKGKQSEQRNQNAIASLLWIHKCLHLRSLRPPKAKRAILAPPLSRPLPPQDLRLSATTRTK